MHFHSDQRFITNNGVYVSIAVLSDLAATNHTTMSLYLKQYLIIRSHL